MKYKEVKTLHQYIERFMKHRYIEINCLEENPPDLCITNFLSKMDHYIYLNKKLSMRYFINRISNANLFKNRLLSFEFKDCEIMMVQSSKKYFDDKRDYISYKVFKVTHLEEVLYFKISTYYLSMKESDVSFSFTEERKSELIDYS